MRLLTRRGDTEEGSDEVREKSLVSYRSETASQRPSAEIAELMRFVRT